MIGSTKHSMCFANPGKREVLDDFVAEYQRVTLLAFDKLWDEGYKKFRVEDDALELEKRLDYKLFEIETRLSARALQCAINQAGGMVRATTERQRRRYWVAKHKGVQLDKLKFSKPELDASRIHPQLNANCVEIQMTEGQFVGFARLKSLGDFEDIFVPVNDSSQFRKWSGREAKLSNSIKLFKDKFQLTWEWKRTPQPQGSRKLGADQGMKTVLTLSDGQTTPERCAHGHSYDSIADKLSRKKRGSKSFGRAQTHRKNFVHWSINRLDFSNAKEVRLERVINIRHGKTVSRKLSHWSNPEIRDKVKRRCEELEVPLREQSCTYRSQRCSQCSVVRKANRKGKLYNCRDCGAKLDADLNSTFNHEEDLPDIPKALRVMKLNLGGFYWKPEGFFRLDGSEIIVPND